MVLSFLLFLIITLSLPTFRLGVSWAQVIYRGSICFSMARCLRADLLPYLVMVHAAYAGCFDFFLSPPLLHLEGLFGPVFWGRFGKSSGLVGVLTTE